MSGYVGKVILDNSEYLVGSTLFGVSSTSASTAAKTVGAGDLTQASGYSGATNLINTNYSNPIVGTTIHVLFLNGNNATSSVTLAVGSYAAHSVTGKFVCGNNTIVSFTLDINGNWIVNDGDRGLQLTDLGAAASKGVVTNMTGNTSSADLPTAEAVANYVSSITSGGAMHFKDAVAADPTTTPPSGTFISGDVVTYNHKEYVYNGTSWLELGDETSYVTKNSQHTDSIGQVTANSSVTVLTAASLSGGSAASLTIANDTNTAAVLDKDDVQIPNVTAIPTFGVSSGVLTITPGSLGTAITATKINDWQANIPANITFTANTLQSLSTSTDTASNITSSSVNVIVPGAAPTT